MSARSIAASASAARWSGRASRCSRPDKLDAALGYIARIPEIWEVILTGGDPLVLSARRLGEVIRRIAAIDHVKIVRLHTRLPVVAPDKITPALVRALKASGKTTYVALHANHPRELTPAVARGLRAHRRCRHSDGEPVGAAARRQRRCRDARSVDARLRRMPHQALLSAPRAISRPARRISAPRSRKARR